MGIVGEMGDGVVEGGEAGVWSLESGVSRLGVWGWEGKEGGCGKGECVCFSLVWNIVLHCTSVLYVFFTWVLPFACQVSGALRIIRIMQIVCEKRLDEVYVLIRINTY